MRVRIITRAIYLPFLVFACFGCADDPTVPATSDATPPSRVTTLRVDSVAPDSIVLTWDAPGDDENTGTATQYDFRYLEELISDTNWDQATPLSGVPDPSVAGTKERLEISLNSPHRYHFGLRTADEVPNWSALSNVVQATSDLVAPSKIDDLEIVEIASNSVVLAWTAPGDDGDQGTAAQYEFRYKAGGAPLNDVNFGDGTSVAVPTPQSPGSREEVQILLTATARYSFGVVAHDDAGNASPLSNVPESDAGGPFIYTYAGTGLNGQSMDGTALEFAEFSTPMDVAFDSSGTPYIVDWNNHRILEVRDGRIYSIVGTGTLGAASDGVANQVGLNHPTNVDFDDQGRIIMSAWHNSKITRIDLTSGMMVRLGGIESLDNNGNRCWNGDDQPAIDSCFDLPVCTAFDSDGNLFVADQKNVRIRKITPVNGEITWSGSQGEPSPIETVVGTGFESENQGGYNGDDLPGTQTHLSAPGAQSAPPSSKLALGPDGDLYFCDTLNNIVRKLDSQGIVRRVAGGGIGTHPVTGRPLSGYAGDGGPATEAALYFPTDLAFDSQGNLYIADTFNSSIRRVDTNGVITTFAGRGARNPDPTALGDGGPAGLAWLDRPWGLAIDADDNVFIVDTYHHRIRVVWN